MMLGIMFQLDALKEPHLTMGDPHKLAEHIEQFELPVSWDNDKCY